MQVKLRNFRWYICALLFAASMISYIDRQAMSIVAPVIAREFHLSNEEVARILSSFLLAYAFGQLAAGRVLDWMGTRAGFAISIVWWSLANMLTAAVTRPWGFSFLRFMLGVGESGNFPGGVKALREWFPPRERPLAGGIFVSGGSVGAVVAAPLVAGITHYWGWRAAFLFTGSLGFLWLILWLLWYRKPAGNAWLTEEERAMLQRQAEAEPEDVIRWSDLLRYRQVWALTIARVLEEPVIWMLLFWLPKYMVDIRGLSVLQTGWLLTVPFIALDIGYISGGWISGKLMRRGWDAQRAKLPIMIVGAAAMASCIPAAFANGVTAFVLLISLATFGHGAWFANLLTMPSDIAPVRLVASLYGITALGGGLGGIVFTEITGIVADRLHSFTPILLVSGLLPASATVALVVIGGRMRHLTVTKPELRVHARFAP